MKRTFLATLTIFAVIGVSASPIQAASAKFTSDGVQCTKVGTAGNDTLRGTSGDDVICGLGGNDKILGLGGNDKIDGGAGNDTIEGGAGNDSELGGSGTDSLVGQAGDDNLVGGGGKDTFDGGAGVNSCDVNDDSREIRDYTCSLLPNLSYLLKRVRGTINGSGYNIDGCALQLQDNNGRVIQGLIYDGGHFEFDSLAGTFYMQVLPYYRGGASDIAKCKPYLGYSITASNIDVTDNMAPLEFNLPALMTARVYVRNSQGTPLKGVRIYAETRQNIGNNASLGNSYEQDWPKGFSGKYTNAQGFVEYLVPVGASMTGYAEARFGGIIMSTGFVSAQTIDLNHPNFNFVLQ